MKSSPALHLQGRIRSGKKCHPVDVLGINRLLGVLDRLCPGLAAQEGDEEGGGVWGFAQGHGKAPGGTCGVAVLVEIEVVDRLAGKSSKGVHGWGRQGSGAAPLSSTTGVSAQWRHTDMRPLRPPWTFKQQFLNLRRDRIYIIFYHRQQSIGDNARHISICCVTSIGVSMPKREATYCYSPSPSCRSFSSSVFGYSEKDRFSSSLVKEITHRSFAGERSLCSQHFHPLSNLVGHQAPALYKEGVVVHRLGI